MAKADETPKFEIGEYVGDEKPGKFDTEVEALIEAQDALPDEKKEAGVRAKITVNVPLTQTNKAGIEKDVVAKYQRYFQDSAKKYGKTARRVGYAEQGDGSANLTFVLTDQIKRPRKAVESESADTETTEAAA